MRIVNGQFEKKFFLQILTAFLVVSVLFLPISSVKAQSARNRLNTKASSQAKEAASSFRGGSQQGNEYQDPMMGPGMSAPPSMGMQGASGAAMMGAGYHIHVLGEVVNPGTYFVPASARLAQAIQLAGGINDEGGERKIELRRQGGAVKHVDLLMFKLHGKLTHNPYLTDNDVVFVPLQDRVVQVVGAVRRPELYELKSEKTLLDAIKLAGGFNNAVAKSEPVRVIRYVEGEKVVDEISNESGDLANYQIKGGDVVVVANVVTKDTEFDYNVASIPGDQVFYPSYEDRVFVLGGVAYPGAYPFSPYYTLSQYISLAGGISDRGGDKFKVTGIDGKTHRAKLSDRVNPGDTIMVKQKVMSNAAWAGFGLSVASFGLAASSTIIAISK